MHRDVVVIHLLQDAPVFKVPVKHLAARPRRTVHPKVLHQVAVVVGALNLIGVPHVAVVGLDVFVQLQTV